MKVSDRLSVGQKNKDMSDQKVPHRLKTMRNAWGLTQTELANLLVGKSDSVLSRIEQAKTCPCTRTLIASTILFGRSIEHLFKSLYDAAEDHVLREAYRLHDKLENDDRPKAKRKRELLAQVISAIMDRQKQQ